MNILLEIVEGRRCVGVWEVVLRVQNSLRGEEDSAGLWEKIVDWGRLVELMKYYSLFWGQKD